MKVFLICFLFLFPLSGTLQAQVPTPRRPTQGKNEPVPVYYVSKYKVKLGLLDHSVLSLPTVNFQGEYLLGNLLSPVSLSLDLGYNYYSQDEQVPVHGIYTGLSVNTYRRQGNGTRIGFFYRNTWVNDYLKVSKELPGLGTYQEYEKMKYRKERYGGMIELFSQQPVLDRFFIELSAGAGLVYMKTIVPDRVTQQDFRNGLVYARETLMPTISLGIKLGYMFMD